jgi:ABC-type branched-subunit amino acid transport system permease subunit
MSRRQSVLMGLVFVAAGAYPFAIGIGLAQARPGSVHAPLWVVALAGGCFVLVGALLLAPDRDVRLKGLVGGVLVTAMALIFDWVAFGPGERHFSGALSIGGMAARSGTGETGGRIAFGVAAVLLDAFALWGWYRWLRGLTEPTRGAQDT